MACRPERVWPGARRSPRGQKGTPDRWWGPGKPGKGPESSHSAAHAVGSRARLGAFCGNHSPHPWEWVTLPVTMEDG